MSIHDIANIFASFIGAFSAFIFMLLITLINAKREERVKKRAVYSFLFSFARMHFGIINIEHIGIDLKFHDVHTFLLKVLEKYSELDKDTREIIDRFELLGTPFIESGVGPETTVGEEKTKMINALIDNIKTKVDKYS